LLDLEKDIRGNVAIHKKMTEIEFNSQDGIMDPVIEVEERPEILLDFSQEEVDKLVNAKLSTKEKELLKAKKKKQEELPKFKKIVISEITHQKKKL
jgi:hypothetical protein